LLAARLRLGTEFVQEPLPEGLHILALKIRIHGHKPTVEHSQPQEFDYRPRPREKALEMLEQRAGPKARKMFERFLARIDKLERSEEEVGAP
jgi:hypothetical protein